MVFHHTGFFHAEFVIGSLLVHAPVFGISEITRMVDN
jgi:hypothetical protein